MIPARMILHVKHIIPSIPNVVIHTLGWDVFVIALAASTELPTNLFIPTVSKGQARIISIEKVKQSLLFNMIPTIWKWLLNLYFAYMPGVISQVPFAAKAK